VCRFQFAHLDWGLVSWRSLRGRIHLQGNSFNDQPDIRIFSRQLKLKITFDASENIVQCLLRQCPPESPKPRNISRRKQSCQLSIETCRFHLHLQISTSPSLPADTLKKALSPSSSTILNLLLSSNSFIIIIIIIFRYPSLSSPFYLVPPPLILFLLTREQEHSRRMGR
jgi:hypothetical protein